MVTIRLHLDTAMPANGCPQVPPGSHRLGLLAADKVREYVDSAQVVSCTSTAGSTLVMRPHVLDASGKSTAAIHRKIPHFEYSSFRLPEGVAWTGRAQAPRSNRFLLPNIF